MVTGRSPVGPPSQETRVTPFWTMSALRREGVQSGGGRVNWSVGPVGKVPGLALTLLDEGGG